MVTGCEPTQHANMGFLQFDCTHYPILHFSKQSRTKTGKTAPEEPIERVNNEQSYFPAYKPLVNRYFLSTRLTVASTDD